MRQLYPSELQAIIQELQRQKLLEKYADQKSKWAFLAAVITNCTAALARAFSGKKRKSKLVEADEFISKDFKKLINQVLYEEKEGKGKYDKHIQDAKQKGLKGPW